MTTRFAVETVHDLQADPNAELQVGRHRHDVLAEVPPAVKTTRFVIETLHDLQADSNAQLQVGRHRHDVLAEVISTVKTTRFVVETLHDLQPDPAAEVQFGRFSFDVLARRFLAPATCPVPAFWRYFSHNFADQFEIESRYSTTISRGAQSLSEERTQRFQRPRRTVTVRWSEKGLDDKRNLMDLMQIIRQFKTEEWMIPLSSHAGCITAGASATDTIVEGDFTLRPFFVGSRVAVVKIQGDRGDVQNDEGDLVGVHVSTIEDKINDTVFQLQDPLPFDVTADRAFLVPMICTHPRLQDTIDQHHCRLWNIEMEFEEHGGKTAIPPSADDLPENFDSYRDLPILRPRHDYSNPLNIEIFQEGEQVEIGRGKSTFPRGATHRVKHRIRMIEEREKGWDYVRFFDTRRGRLRPFWMIDQEMLFTINNLQTSFIEVTKLGDFDEFKKNSEFFGFMMKDGTCYVREIVTFDDLASWRLTVADVLPAGLSAQNVVLAGRARPTRMQEDSFKTRWFHINAVQFEVRTISLLQEKDVTLDP